MSERDSLAGRTQRGVTEIYNDLKRQRRMDDPRWCKRCNFRSKLYVASEDIGEEVWDKYQCTECGRWTWAIDEQHPPERRPTTNGWYRRNTQRAR